MFEKKFSALNISGTYDLCEIEKIEDLEIFLDKNSDFTGFNVTVPYKKSILPYLDYIDSHAKAIGAVNTVKIIRTTDGQISLSGYNTDWSGFLETLRTFDLTRIKRAVILGTGGASKAVAYALTQLGIKTTFVSRTEKDNVITYQNLTKDTFDAHQLIINTTPLGMYPDTEDAPHIPYEYIKAEHICYDLIYNPGVTEFLSRCSNQGATIKNGFEMLIRQAEKAWEIWSRR
ncbi:MAG: shikimate dehydrogenase [Muribaculaceae bacterium]|nr:shikimate dehydrogenase [Muribaculaceae bacterium]